MTLVPVVNSDLQLAQKILRSDVLPAWRKRVTATDFAQWQRTIGKVIQ